MTDRSRQRNQVQQLRARAAQAEEKLEVCRFGLRSLRDQHVTVLSSSFGRGSEAERCGLKCRGRLVLSGSGKWLLKAEAGAAAQSASFRSRSKAEGMESQDEVLLQWLVRQDLQGTSAAPDQRAEVRAQGCFMKLLVLQLAFDCLAAMTCLVTPDSWGPRCTCRITWGGLVIFIHFNT